MEEIGAGTVLSLLQEWNPTSRKNRETLRQAQAGCGAPTFRCP